MKIHKSAVPLIASLLGTTSRKIIEGGKWEGDTLVVDVNHAEYPRQRKPLFDESQLAGYDPATSPDSPRFGSCCDPAKKRE